MKKKAKLAHEKRNEHQTPTETTKRFTFASVHQVIDSPETGPAAIVDLDGKGTMALVDRWYVTQAQGSDQWSPGNAACPAAYDAIARDKAIQAYQQYQQDAGAAQ